MLPCAFLRAFKKDYTMNAITNTLPAWATQTSEATQANILALQSKANSALSRARALENKVQNEGRDMTDEELAFTDSQLESFAKFQNEIEGYKPQGRKSTPSALSSAPAVHTSSKSFSAMFKNTDTRTPFENLGEFARAVYVNDPKLFTNAAGMSGGVGADGGYYIPQGFLAGLVDGALQAEAIRPRATVVALPSGTTTIPMFNTSDRSSSLANLEPEATAEGATGTNQKALIGSVTMSAVKQMILVPTTSELMEDAPALFDTLLQKYMQDSLSQKLDDLFINGNGAGQPLGIVSAPCTVSVAKDSSQVAATVTPTNLAGMISRLAPGSFAKAVWLAHPSVLASLFVMAVTIKNVAASENVGGFGPNWFTVNADGTMSLLGRPLIVSDRCQQLGTVGDIVLADLSQYLVGIRGDARLMVDNSVGFKSAEIYFRLTLRVDGQPLLGSAITPRNGTSTLSPFVTLATRS
jgi:HK97 family phage major capsid protein